MSIAQADPRTHLRVFWRWKLLFLALALGVPGLAYFLASREKRVYQSSLLLQEGALPVDTSLFSSGTAAAPSASPDAVTLGGEARVIETPVVAALAARHLKPAPADPSSLLQNVTATGDATTGFITVTARASDPRRAAHIANAFGAAVVTLRTQQAFRLLATAIDQVSVQLKQMKRGDVGRSQLSAQLERLRALRAAQGANAQVLQAAVPSSSPVSPRTARVVALGILGGLLLGIGAVFAIEAADRRVRHPEDLEELTGLPLLAVIPRRAFSEKRPGRQEDEAFHMLRSALTYFNVDRPLSTILIASPVEGDGKTTVATRLAVAAAAGGQNVILIDGDLRRPQAASRLGVKGEVVEEGYGLSAVLSGQGLLGKALVDVPIAGTEQEAPVLRELDGRLRLLPAGALPPNPSELLASRRMRDVLSEASEMADLVIIDTNPLLSVSDSLALLDVVSGVVVVARLNATTKDAVRRFQKTISNTSAIELGVVATGAAGGLYGRYGYGSGYGYFGNTSRAYANGNKPRGVIRERSRARKAKRTS